MKRTIIISLALITLATGVAVAQPWGGDRPEGFGPLPAGMEEAPEIQTLEGRLRLAENERPMLVSGGREYGLAINPVLAAELSVTDGQTIEVEGYVVTMPGRDLLGDDMVVHVRAVEAGGTRVVVPEGMNPGGGPGAGPGSGGRRGGGPMGHRGGGPGRAPGNGGW